MLRAADFQLLSVQAALFLVDTKSLTQSGFLAAILSKYADRYNGAVQAIPFSGNAPPEIPRVILQSQDEQWKVQAALNRVDSFWVATETPERDDGVTRQCAEVLEHYIQMNLSVQIARLGLVISRVVETENAAQELIDRFCNEASKVQPLNRSENFEIHNHKTYNLRQTNYAINSWVRCKTGRRTEQPARKVVIVEQDINTLEDPGNVFTLESIQSFYQECQTEMSEILSIYFP
jgi:hypothetical protein